MRLLLCLAGALLICTACGEDAAEPPGPTGPKEVAFHRNGQAWTTLDVEGLRGVAGETDGDWELSAVLTALGQPSWFFVQAGQVRLTPRVRAGLTIRDETLWLVRPDAEAVPCPAVLHVAAIVDGSSRAGPSEKGRTPNLLGLGEPVALSREVLAAHATVGVRRRGGRVDAHPLWETLTALGVRGARAVRLRAASNHSLELPWPADGSPAWSRAVLVRNRRGGLHVLLDAERVGQAEAPKDMVSGAGHGSGRGTGGGAKDPRSTGELRHLLSIEVLPARAGD